MSVSSWLESRAGSLLSAVWRGQGGSSLAISLMQMSGGGRFWPWVTALDLRRKHGFYLGSGLWKQAGPVLQGRASLELPL